MNLQKYRLVLFDVDSTLIEQEVIDLLAKRTKFGEKVSDITRLAMAGELNFDQALVERVALLKGLPESVIDDVLREISFSPGAIELIHELKARNYRIGAVSGGFINVLSKAFKHLNLDYLRANYLEVEDGQLTGRLLGTIVNRAIKKESLLEFTSQQEVDLSETIAIGDGANDVEMVKSAGLGVSYRGKPVLNEVADVVITNPRLDTLLQYL